VMQGMLSLNFGPPRKAMEDWLASKSKESRRNTQLGVASAELLAVGLSHVRNTMLSLYHQIYKVQLSRTLVRSIAVLLASFPLFGPGYE
jgi:hypothetical protein